MTYSRRCRHSCRRAAKRASRAWSAAPKAAGSVRASDAAQRIAVHLEAEQRLVGGIDQRRAQHHGERNLVARVGDDAQQMGEIVDLAAVIEAAAAIHHVRNAGGVERGGELGNHFGVAHQDGDILECEIRRTPGCGAPPTEPPPPGRGRRSLPRNSPARRRICGPATRARSSIPGSPGGDGLHGAQNLGAAAEVVHQLDQVAAARQRRRRGRR